MGITWKTALSSRGREAAVAISMVEIASSLRSSQ